MESYPKYQDLSSDMQEEKRNNTFDTWMAAVFLRGSDQSVDGELVRDYRKDLTLGYEYMCKDSFTLGRIAYVYFCNFYKIKI